MIRPYEAVAHTVKTVRFKISRKILISFFFIKQIFFYDAILIRCPGTIKTHLVILVVNHNMMKGKFQIGKYTQISYGFSCIAKLYIPYLHRFPSGDHHCLGRLNSLIVTFVDRIRHPVPASIVCLCKRLAYRLPRYGPIIRIVIITQIHIKSRPVHRHRVSSKAADPVIFRRLIEQIAARRVVYDRRHILYTDIICP